MIPLTPLLLGTGAFLVGKHGSSRFSAGSEMDRQAREFEREGLFTLKDAEHELETTRGKLTDLLVLNGEARLKALELVRAIAERLQQQSLPLEASLQAVVAEALRRPIVKAEGLDAAALSLGLGASGGALAGVALYGGVGLLGTASTGTAIGTLSGAAKHSAILAWLGGGSKATGGWGETGGAFVLFGIAFGTAMAVGGEVSAFFAQDRLIDAKRFFRQAQDMAGEYAVVTRGLRAIGNAAKRCSTSLATLSTQAKRLASEASNEAAHPRLAQTLRYLLVLADYPLLNENNEINLGVLPLFETLDSFLATE